MHIGRYNPLILLRMKLTPVALCTEPQMADFFNIYEVDGIKRIHFFGYLYESDTYWADMQCVGIDLPLDEFIEKAHDYNDLGECFLDELYEQCKQYQEDLTDEEAVRVFNTYFDGKPADYFCPVLALTEEHPCGNYIC